MWRDPDDDPLSEEASEEEGSEEESSEGEEGPAPGPSSAAGAAAGSEPEQPLTREQRKALAKARKEAAIRKKQEMERAAQPGDLPPTDSDEEEDDDDDDDIPPNPNRTPNKPSSSKDGTPELSRREREAVEAQKARDKYMKLHMEGKTEEARADLERLRLIREQREAAKARKEAEKEEKEARMREKAALIAQRQQKLQQAAAGKKGPPKKTKK